MARRRLSEGQRWQIIGLHAAGMSFKAIGRQTGYHYTVISRLIRKHAQTNQVKDRPRSGRPPVTSHRENRALIRLARRLPFATSTVLKRLWLPNRRLSSKTVNNRLRAAGLASRRVIRRPLLTNDHKRRRLMWCRARENWNLRSWRRIHWSDESRFMLHPKDGRIRVWRRRNTAYAPRNILPNVPFGGGSVMVWGCFSHDCKLDLLTIRDNLTGARYIQEVLQPHVVPHFDNHTLASRPVFMDDNARPHRSMAVNLFIQQNAVDRCDWPAMSPDLNPIEHIWDIIGRRVQAREPPPQNLNELEAALHEEWQRIPMIQFQRLVRGMRRRVGAVIQAIGGSTRY